jgi:adenosylcobinamide-GDP ribazoletransferase
LPDGQRWWTIALMPLAGRSALVFQMGLLPYARPEGGLARVFVEKCGLFQQIFAAVFLMGTGWLTLAWPGLIAAGATVAMTVLFALYCHRKIGGLTGDTLGAGCELAELVPALTIIVCEGRC